MEPKDFLTLRHLLDTDILPPIDVISREIDRFHHVTAYRPTYFVTDVEYANRISGIIQNVVTGAQHSGVTLGPRIGDWAFHLRSQLLEHANNIRNDISVEHASRGVTVETSGYAGSPIHVCSFIRHTLIKKRLITKDSVMASRMFLRSDYGSGVSTQRWRKLPPIPRRWIRSILAPKVISATLRGSISKNEIRDILDSYLDIFDSLVLLGLPSDRKFLSECEWSLVFSFALDPHRSGSSASSIDLENLYMLTSAALGQQDSFRMTLTQFSVVLSVLSSVKAMLVSSVFGSADESNPTDSLGIFREVFRTLACGRSPCKKPLRQLTVSRRQFVDYITELDQKPDDQKLSDVTVTWETFLRTIDGSNLLSRVSAGDVSIYWVLIGN